MAQSKKTAPASPLKKKKPVKAAGKTASAKKKRETAAVKTAKATKTAAKTAARPVAKKVRKASAASRKSAPKTIAAPREAASSYNLNNLNMETIMKQSPVQFDQLAQDIAEASREGVEAFVKSGAVFASNLEKIMRTAAELMQNSAEKQSQYFKDAMSSKTLNEWAEMQNRIAQKNFDDFMEGSTRLSEMGVKMLSEASEPLNAQAGKVMKRAKAA